MYLLWHDDDDVLPSLFLPLSSVPNTSAWVFTIFLLSKLHLACFQVCSTREKEISLKIAMALATFEVKPKVARAILGGGCQTTLKIKFKKIFE